MARPTSPKSTTIISAMRTMACPRCDRFEPRSNSVLRVVDRCGGDDDVVGDELLYERGDGHEVEANRHLQGCVVVGRVGAAAGPAVERPHLAGRRGFQSRG